MGDKIQSGLAKAGVASAEKHLLLCIGPDCCKSREGEALWDFVKHRIKETRLRVMRTKAGCFRICHGGPWLVVYPDGVWYGQVTPARFERILQQHLVGDRPVREWVIAENALRCPAKSASSDD
jgi:(2Fe-2S) ferredoxin